MDPGRPSPLKHAHRFARIRLAADRRSPRRAADDFSWRTFGLQTVVAPLSDAECAASFAAPMTAPESSRDVSDPTRGPRTLTPGSVRGSLTSRLPMRLCSQTCRRATRWFVGRVLNTIVRGQHARKS